jgi:dihydrofolate synthase/folylpolyglutamate synthase
MNYAEAVAHLYALGPELAVSSPVAAGDAPAPRRKFDLAHMRALCAALGNPQQQFPSVLIAGTNGKGSTAATLASILTAAGYRTGLYTSPHLIRVKERMQLSSNGVLEPIRDEDFARLYTVVDTTCEELVAEGRLPQLPSFFERLTAIAFLYFAEAARIVVLEVGLGGRLDATNVVEPLISIVTDIALDHQEYLGDTIAEIAREKCGILRERGTLVTLPQHPEANQAIGEVATALNVRAINAAVYLPPAVRNGATAESSLPPNRYTLNLEDPIEAGLLQVDSPLPGAHQQRNLALAIAAALELRNEHSYNITNAALEQGIRATAWPGRLEWIAPNLLLDVAHNPAGAWTLRGALSTLLPEQPRTLIFSCLRDKNLTEMSRILFPLFDSSADGDPLRRHDHIILAPIANPRAASVEDLLAAAHALGVPAHASPHLAAALAQARRITPPAGLIVATGSVYLVGEIRELALATHEQNEAGMVPA